MLLDLSGNKYNPNAMDDWQDAAVELYQGGKILMPYLQEAANQVQTMYRDMTRASNRYFTPPQTQMSVAPGYGGDPIKGPMGNSTVSAPIQPMAYGRKYRTRAPYARSYTRKRKSSGISKGLAAEVRKIAKRAIRADEEIKFSVTPVAAFTPAANTATIQCWTNIAQSAGNSTDTTRIGDQILCRDIEVRATIASTGAPADPFRVIVFKWKPNGSPVVGNILDSTGTTVLQAPLAQDVLRSHQFTILMDTTYLTSSVDADITPCVWKFKLDSKVSYIGGSTTSQENGVWVLFVNVNGTSAISYTLCMRFTDA